MRRIAVIAGDGVGPEVITEAVKALTAVQDRAGLEIQMDHFPFGTEHYLKTGLSLPADLADSFREEYDAILLGPLSEAHLPESVHVRGINTLLGSKLDLYVQLRPVNLLEARYCPLKDKSSGEINFILLSEYSEGVQAGRGGVFRPGTTEEIAFRQCLHTYRGVERFLRYAFEYTRLHGLKKLTLACQGDPGLVAEDLWERIFRQIAHDYAEVDTTCYSVNYLLRQLLRSPESFEVIATCSLYGEIISDLGAQLQGGAGLAACARLHPHRVSVFSPAHHSTPKQAGQNTANPLGAIASAALLLQHLGFDQEAHWVNSAIQYTLETNNTTRDLGGRLGTSQVGDFISNQIQRGIT